MSSKRADDALGAADAQVAIDALGAMPEFVERSPHATLTITVGGNPGRRIGTSNG